MTVQYASAKPHASGFAKQIPIKPKNCMDSGVDRDFEFHMLALLIVKILDQ